MVAGEAVKEVRVDEPRQEQGPDVGVALQRVVLGYRVVAACWVGLLALIGWVGDRLPAEVAGGVTALAVAWALVTVGLARRRPEVLASAPWIAVDVAVAASLIVLPTVLADRAVTVAGGFPFAAVLLAAWMRGYAGSLSVAVLLATASAFRPGRLEPGEVLVGSAANDYAFYLLGAAVVAWGIDVLRRNDVQRRDAQAALAKERERRLVAQERSETAAHLHDSVLQTLALIQRHADAPSEARTLARRQERELRSWLYGERDPSSPATLHAALDAAADSVEADHQVAVEVVVVGDCALGPPVEALAHAVREAMVNAARHAGVDEVSVYVEVEDDAVTAFVRDRGRGFDPGSVEPGRLGIAQSIVGRMARHGGRAEVQSAPGEGTEVVVEVPR